ncbi:protein phosphatase 1 regulatory subunit 36 isoform X2 [Halichoeres trimaculatus]|uniref:protein phosphatase 1 regulatory subunit 36 isoform X2 n=1 Tax=Halichoeres trimaculatus TaxID=147232 RepID=UPI003D9F9331
MRKYNEEKINVNVPPPGRWLWNNEAETLEFVSSSPAEKGVTRERKQRNDTFRELRVRAEWLAGVCALNHRGRQSTRKSLSPAHLSAYRSSVMKREGTQVTLDDVKQVAVHLLQENYLLPIPFSFLALLKGKELDGVLTCLLLYLSCFFDQKYLENKSTSQMLDIITERQMMAKALAKKEISQKKLAVNYFSLIMDLEIEQHQRSSYCKKDMKDIQEEVGRLFYSDTFNTAVRSRADGDPETTSAVGDGSVKTGETDPEETGSNCSFQQRQVEKRSFQKLPSLNSIANQRSPLLVSLLPSPKELSLHLFHSRRARRQSPLPVEHCDTTSLTEELDQQLADVSFGILGKPLSHFSRSTLIPLGEQQNDSDEEEDQELRRDF